jgi:general secretion pathway protein G
MKGPELGGETPCPGEVHPSAGYRACTPEEAGSGECPNGATGHCVAPRSPFDLATTGKLDGTAAKSRGRRLAGQHGFTLVELLLVMSIITTIAAMAVPSLMSAINEAKIARAVGDVSALETEIAEYDVLNGKLPDTLADIGRANLLDPWGNPYQYLNHSTKKGNGQSRKDRFLVPLNSDYDLYSMGADGKSSSPITAKNSQDDIIRAADGGYIGLASEF